MTISCNGDNDDDDGGGGRFSETNELNPSREDEEDKEDAAPPPLVMTTMPTSSRAVTASSSDSGADVVIKDDGDESSSTSTSTKKKKKQKRKRKAARGVCSGCQGTGVTPCKSCRGTGVLAPGGFHAKNHVDVKNIVGTNWTAHRRTQGWRHFEAVGKSPADKANGKPAMVHLAATCDRDITVWVRLHYTYSLSDPTESPTNQSNKPPLLRVLASTLYNTTGKHTLFHLRRCPLFGNFFFGNFKVAIFISIYFTSTKYKLGLLGFCKSFNSFLSDHFLPLLHPPLLHFIFRNPFVPSRTHTPNIRRAHARSRSRRYR